MSNTVAVTLTGEQIAFLRDSLDYSAEKFRNQDYGPGLDDFGRERRREMDEMIASIRAALADAE
jgi:hypothetical protein